jgi:hypothetical protein
MGFPLGSSRSNGSVNIRLNMPDLTPYSKRKKKAQERPGRAYEYDRFPRGARVALTYKIGDLDAAFGGYRTSEGTTLEPSIKRFLASEWGEFSVEKMSIAQILRLDDVERILDAIEAALHLAESILEIQVVNPFQRAAMEKALADFPEKVNKILEEYGLGYRLHNGLIILIGAPILTDGAIKPAMNLLASPGYDAAEGNFARALGFLRSGKNGESISWANAALESTLKIILKARRVSYDEASATSKHLIPLILGVPGFVPSFLNNFSENLKQLLFGVSVVRNKTPPAHGARIKADDPQREDAEFVLNLVATYVVFLIHRHRATK